jgi:deoxyribodipyrimidine photo-lyase
MRQSLLRPGHIELIRLKCLQVVHRTLQQYHLQRVLPNQFHNQTSSRFLHHCHPSNMPPNFAKGPYAPSKRKAENTQAPPPNKKAKPANGSNGVPRYKDSTNEIKYGIVQREFYPPEMSNERAKQYIAGEIERPIETLEKAIIETRDARDRIEVKDSVVHYFKCDIRTKDNHALHLASEKAKSKGVPLIGLFIVSPQDWQAHVTSAVRVDFVLRTLEVLKQDLAALDIPLYVETVEKRKKIPARIMELCEKWGTSHVYCNTEYEVDELRREATLTRECLERKISFNVAPDTCVVEPGKLMSGAGSQMSVYTPWFRRWCAYLNANPGNLEEFSAPGQNPSSARESFKELFDCPIPEAPENKRLTSEEKQRFKNMWPPGEHEAHLRLDKFRLQKMNKYSEQRNFPAANATSILSAHLAAGTLVARTCIRAAQAANTTMKLDGGLEAMKSWISEVAWRDFYKHVLVHWPFVCMNKSFKPEYTNIEWEYNDEQFEKWTQGKTGFPIVDAAMRQLNYTGYMHNRCRMIVACFLAKDLLIDWRMGERYFMERLIDGDFASNNGGWGFSASTGVDPQPYFRIFNPLLQSEKFDLDGEYIRKWVPELKDVRGKAIHDPYGRGSEALAKKNGYPKQIVDHKFVRDRALSRYKAGLGRETT